MKTLLATVLSICACISFGQQIPSPDPIPSTTFQDNLWDDLWQDEYIPGTDFIFSTSPLELTTHDIHRGEWHNGPNYPDGWELNSFENTATMNDITVFDMPYIAMEVAEVGVDDTFDSVLVQWSATITVTESAFVGTITVNEIYSPHIYGLVRSIEIQADANSGGGLSVYHIWMPLGRGKTYQDAWLAAVNLSAEVEYPPQPIIDAETCEAIYLNRRTQAVDDYLDNMNGCGGISPALSSIWDGLVGGAGDGALLGGTLGGAVGLFTGGPAVAGAGATGGGILGGLLGGVIGGVHRPFSDHSKCIQDAKDEYNNRYQHDWDCYQECLDLGDWFCG